MSHEYAGIYRADHKLIITNEPGSVPSVTKVDVGQLFELDGTEVINVPSLIVLGVMHREEPPKKKARGKKSDE